MKYHDLLHGTGSSWVTVKSSASTCSKLSPSLQPSLFNSSSTPSAAPSLLHSSPLSFLKRFDSVLDDICHTGRGAAACIHPPPIILLHYDATAEIWGLVQQNTEVYTWFENTSQSLFALVGLLFQKWTQLTEILELGSSLKNWTIKGSAKSDEAAQAELSLSSYALFKKQRCVILHKKPEDSKTAYKYSALKSTMVQEEI